MTGIRRASFLALTSILLIVGLVRADETYATYTRDQAAAERQFATKAMSVSMGACQDAYEKLQQATSSFNAARPGMEQQELWLTIAECEEGLALASSKLSAAQTADCGAWDSYEYGNMLENGEAEDWAYLAFYESRWDAAASLFVSARTAYSEAKDSYYDAADKAYESKTASEYVLSLIP